MSWVRVVAAGLCASVIGGCGSGAATTPTAAPPTASATPTAALGTTFTGSHFATVVPAGWTNKLGDAAEVRKFGGTGEVEYLVEQQPPGTIEPNVNDVIANINVVQLATAVPDDQMPPYLTSVTNSGASNLSAVRSFTIDGATGQYITYDRDISGTPGESQDMVVNHSGISYGIVIITSQFAFPRQQAALQAVLTAWRWLR